MDLIKVYQKLSKLFLKPPSCRYYPSCSRYASQAIRTKGLLKGGLLAAWRLLRCNPWSKGGYDPVAPDSVDSAGADSGLKTES